MSRLSRYLREHGVGCWLSFVLFAHKACNIALVFVGIAMLAYAGDIIATQQHPQPPQRQQYLQLQSTSQDVTTATLTSPAWPSWLPALHLPSLPPAALAFLVMGLLACLSAAAALGAAAVHSLALLNTHLVLLALLLAGQVCLAAAVASDDGGREGQPGAASNPHSTTSSSTVTYGSSSMYGSSSGSSKALKYGGVSSSASIRVQLRNALVAYEWADVVSATVELLSLLLGCLLHSAYVRAEEAAEDAEEALGLPDGEAAAPFLTSRRRADRQQQQQSPGGSRRTPLPQRVRRDDSWSRRMRDQYGVDTAGLSYDPLAGMAGGGGG
ncbi:hypothetical protein Agub_g12895, partial [Astrephomene gubernaculifera]